MRRKRRVKTRPRHCRAVFFSKVPTASLSRGPNSMSSRRAAAFPTSSRTGPPISLTVARIFCSDAGCCQANTASCKVAQSFNTPAHCSASQADWHRHRFCNHRSSVLPNFSNLRGAISAAGRSCRMSRARSARALAIRQCRRRCCTRTACRRGRNHTHPPVLVPRHGRSGCSSQTQPVLSQTKHAMGKICCCAPESESGPVFRYSACHCGPRTLVLKTDGYGPSIKLDIWYLSANSHFGPQSLAQTLLPAPPFIRLACCLRASDPNEHSFHGYFRF
jgi:hypothetical protein